MVQVIDKEQIDPKGLYCADGPGLTAVVSCGCAVQVEESCGCCYEHNILCGQCWLEELAAAACEDRFRFGDDGPLMAEGAEALLADGPWGGDEVDEDVFHYLNLIVEGKGDYRG